MLHQYILDDTVKLAIIVRTAARSLQSVHVFPEVTDAIRYKSRCLLRSRLKKKYNTFLSLKNFKFFNTICNCQKIIHEINCSLMFLFLCLGSNYQNR